MSEFKEIGGFIVSADPFVNHDSTLSGYGTEVSPLGVDKVALYDAGIKNIVVTASLPAEPDSDTIYMIPEA